MVNKGGAGGSNRHGGLTPRHNMESGETARRGPFRGRADGGQTPGRRKDEWCHGAQRGRAGARGPNSLREDTLRKKGIRNSGERFFV